MRQYLLAVASEQQLQGMGEAFDPGLVRRAVQDADNIAGVA